VQFRYLQILAFLSVALATARFSPAQTTTTGQVYGRVIDKDERKALPGAVITLENLRNGHPTAARTNDKGTYFFGLVEPGNYVVRATKENYRIEEYPRIVVPLNQPKLVIPVFALTKTQPGQGASMIRDVTKGPMVFSLRPPQTPVSAPVPLAGLTSMVSLRDWALRFNFDSSIVSVLPLRGGRTFDQLAFFAPGVARAPFTPGEGPAVGIGVGSIGQFSANGLRSRSNNFTVDGSDNNDEDIGVRRQGFVALVPQSTESIDEFQVMTAGFPADFGRNSGSIVNAVSRSGPSAVNGSLYGLLNNNALNSRNFFDTRFTDSVNQGNLNGGQFAGEDSTASQYGGLIGGPVVEKRLFYFASGERQQSHGMALKHFAVPAESDRGLRTRSGFVPIAGLQDFFNDQYSSAAGSSILSLYPLPNNPAGPYGAHNYSQAGRFEANSSSMSTRVDWYPSIHSIETRYNSTDDDSRIPFTGDAINSAIGTRTKTRNLSIVANSTTTSWANSLRVSYGRTHLAFPLDKGSPLLFGSSPIGAPAALIRQVQTPYGNFGPFGVSGPIGQLSILPYSSIGVDVYNFPQGRVDNTYQLSDFITRIGNDHVLKAGFDIRHSQLNSFADRNSRPLIVFGYGKVGSTCMQNLLCDFATSDGLLRGTDLAALGAPSGVLQALSTDPSADTTIGLRLTNYDLFFQDDWEVGRGLTLNLGVRYELQTVPHETNNRIEKTFGLTPDQFGHLDPVGTIENQSIIRAGNRAFDQAIQGLQQFLGGRTRIYEPDRNNVAPRVGFAWDPTGSGTTAIHAGFSVQFDANPGAFTSQSRNVFPTFVPVNLDLNFARPSGLFINNPTFFTFRPTQTPLIKPGTLNVYNLTGNAFATGLGTLFNQQPANPTDNLSGNGLAFTLPEKNLKTGYAENVVVSAEHQFGDNWLGSIAYVGTRGEHLPRFTTPNGGLISSPVLLSSPIQPLTIADEPPYGGRPVSSLGAFTVMENSAASHYDSMQLSVMKRLSRGLQFRSSWTWSHAIDEVSDMFDSRGFFALPEDSTRPDRDHASANFDVRHRVTGFLTWNGFRYWNFALTAELETGQPYTVNTLIDRNGDGNLTDRPGIGRNTARARGVQTLDAAITRTFSLGGRYALDARVEAYNILNSTNFGIPVRILESPGFGSSFDTQINSRSIRLAAKLNFGGLRPGN
jgi:hypothetical protein